MKGNGTKGKGKMSKFAFRMSSYRLIIFPKGRLVFFRTINAENRNAIQSLYEGINKDLKVQKVEGVSTVLAHIYPEIGSGEKNNIFDSITPDEVATLLIEGEFD
jgi:hypothetical protein